MSMLKWLKQLFPTAEKTQDSSVDYLSPTSENNRGIATDNSVKLKEEGDLKLGAEDFVAAATYYRQAIAINPNYAKAHTNLGFVLKEQGLEDDAVHHLERALAIDSTIADAHYLLGSLAKSRSESDKAIVHFRSALNLAPALEFAYLDLCSLLLENQQLEDARQLLIQGIAHNPHFINLHYYLGKTYHNEQKFDLAITCFQTALSIQSDHPDVLHGLGLAFLQSGLNDQAVLAFQSALLIVPNNAHLHVALGSALQRQNKIKDAIVCYEQALALDPYNVDAHYNLGVASGEEGNIDLATSCYQTALEIDPLHLASCFNLGIIFQRKNDYQRAEYYYNKAAIINPTFIDAQISLGLVFHAQGKLDEAIKKFKYALTIDPNHITGLLNLTTLLSEKKTAFKETIACCDKIFESHPEHADAHLYKAFFLLREGHLLAGWHEYEYRWKTKESQAKPHYPEPEWQGEESLTGKKILLYEEQGLGDTLQFVRYTTMLEALGATVYLLVAPALKSLLTSCPGVSAVFSTGDTIPSFDYQCAMMSLPLAFKTELISIPKNIPYLVGSASNVLQWQNKLGKKKMIRVGIVWAGNPMKHTSIGNARDRVRSIAFEQLRPLLDIPSVEFFSLQLGEEAVKQLQNAPQVIDFTEDITDFNDTAALIANLDLVISVDTSVVHLTGAIGKPVWILNRYNTCWRWLNDGEESPWYPTARIFRQPSMGDWNSVIDEVEQALIDHVNQFNQLIN